ncbi:MAG: L,D-transpeptidase family protein, partial [Hyphomicrobiaceae bacterium]|nr:L,D-transpeptidase family protein [Hyphomicrobiaceae bacterium]
PQHEQFKRLRTAYLKALEDEKNPNAASSEPEPNGKRRKSKRKRKSKTKLSARLLYNMEMWRWMPRELGQKYILANIPEFEFRLVDGGHVIHSERIITGKVKHMTPIFSDEMETVVLNPRWNVPNSIKVKEILPGLLKGRDVIGRQGLRVRYGGSDVDPYSIDWASADIRNFHIYQPPGGSNALGRVKFLFPNSHAVYMHDTPTKYLFKRKVRAFSHGCVRVRDPIRFAEVLLAADKGWTRKDIDRLLRNRDDENPVKLSKKIPVHITYFTAWVDADAKVHLYSDIYSHERLIQMGLDGKAHLIVKPKENLGSDLNRIVGQRRRTEQVTSNYGGYSNGRPPRWIREMWGWD